MILVDANLLLYAYDTSSDRHERARQWLRSVLVSDDEIRFALMTLLAFVRIASNPSVFERPMRPEEAIAVVSELLERPNVSLAEPTARHWSLLADVARDGQARGSQVMDAHLAVLAIEHGATLYTTDRDFARYRGLRLVDPMTAA